MNRTIKTRRKLDKEFRRLDKLVAKAEAKSNLHQKMSEKYERLADRLEARLVKVDERIHRLIADKL